METEILSSMSERKLNSWIEFMKSSGLKPDSMIHKTVIISEGGKIIAAGSRYENILKFIAVDKNYRGEGLTATIITELRRDAFNNGFTKLFLYTKPENKEMFSSLFFYPIAETKDILFMESVKNGIEAFLSSLNQQRKDGIIGGAVMNCNPFSEGHRYLIEKAALECDYLYIFVVSEDKSQFSFTDRFNMVKKGTEDIKNVIVLPTGPYLISSATFPDYFLKDRESVEEIHCILDIEIFAKYFAKEFNITRRYVGTEPLSPLTSGYNHALKEYLPGNIELIEIPRFCVDGIPVSAGRIRELIKNNDTKELKKLLPATSYEYLSNNNLI